LVVEYVAIRRAIARGELTLIVEQAESIALALAEKPRH